MNNEQKYLFRDGPLDGQTRPGPDKGMGRTPNYLQPSADGLLAVVRADKGDQALGKAARTGTPVHLYLLDGSSPAPGHHVYQWLDRVQAASVNNGYEWIYSGSHTSKAAAL